MSKLVEHLIKEFKKIKKVRGNLFENFLTFVNLILTGEKDDKYKVGRIQILKYIADNEKAIKLELIKN
tara:strand:- start:1640 stop:1843 length:204 start_codon:yes stop_codon:yes gene_type:complete